MPQPKQLQLTITRLTADHANDSDYSHPKIGLAISGGPDSIALLLLLHRHYQGKICAATVDHGLRSEAADEADFVANICDTLNVPHHILKPKTPISGNIQSGARKIRYALLQQWASETGCDYIATAHHADDQLETMIMRINRASGVAGLAGIRERNGNIIRPLLQYRKADLIEICMDARIAPIDDPSNSNDDYDRVRVRQWMQKSESVGFDPLINPLMAQKTASHMNDAEAAIQFSVEILAREHIENEGDTVILDVSKLPVEYQRRLLRLAILRIKPDASPRGQSIEDTIISLKNNDISMLCDVKCVPIKTGKARLISVWQLSKAPPRRHG